MQIIYISTSAEKYLSFHFQNMNARRIFASSNLTSRCLSIKEEYGRVIKISHYLKKKMELAALIELG